MTLRKVLTGAALTLAGIGAVAVGSNPARVRPGPRRRRAPVHRDRQHWRRLLSVRRRPGKNHRRVAARAGDRRSDRGLRRQPQADPAAESRHRVRAGRHAGRRRCADTGAFQRTGAVKARALAVLYPNYTHVATIAGTASSGSRICAAASSRPDSAGQRDRSDRVPHAARGRSRSGSGHPASGAVRQRVGGCDEGREDRRVLLERRPAHGVHPRPGQLDWHHGEAPAE